MTIKASIKIELTSEDGSRKLFIEVGATIPTADRAWLAQALSQRIRDIADTIPGPADWRPVSAGMPREFLPPPETLIGTAEGQAEPLMFLYAPEEMSDVQTRGVLNTNGFDMLAVWMHEVAGDDSPAAKAYYDGDIEQALALWDVATPEGWTFGGKHDTDEGPVAVFLRRKGQADDGEIDPNAMTGDEAQRLVPRPTSDEGE